MSGSGQTIRLTNVGNRTLAHRWIDIAPHGAVLNIREATRTNEQNALMWSLLSDISRTKPQGRVLPPEVWKCVFMAAVGHQCRFEPALDGNGVVPVGFKSSRLTKAEMSDLIECILAFGAEHGVQWTADESKAA